MVPRRYAEQEPDRFAFFTGEQVVDIDTAGKKVYTSKNHYFK